jgi:5-methylcytosine-specific restriction endonuclease McrA
MLDSFKILVLNFSYEPLQFCSARNAINMVFGGRAEGLESAGYTVRTPSTNFQLPTVIRVLQMVSRNRKKGLAFSRKNILRRDNYTCQYCGTTNNHLTVDHVVPKSRGGKTSWTNIVAACNTCNLKKGNRTPFEVDMQLSQLPRKPDYQFTPFVIPSGPDSHIEIWQKYLPEKFSVEPVAF